MKDNLSIPLLTAIGNNERQGDDYGLYHDIFGPLYYSFKIGKNCFFVLDNADGKGLDRKQELWLANELEKSRNCDTRIVFMHIPLYDPEMGGDPHCLGEQASENLIRLFLKYQVTHIFVSHIHGYFKGRWKGIPYTITGGAGAGLVGSNPDHYFFHFLKVHIKNGNLDVEVKQVPSSYEWLGRSGYMAWTSMYSFFRFHGIQALLLLVAAGLVMAIYLRE